MRPQISVGFSLIYSVCMAVSSLLSWVILRLILLKPHLHTQTNVESSWSILAHTKQESDWLQANNSLGPLPFMSFFWLYWSGLWWSHFWGYPLWHILFLHSPEALLWYLSWVVLWQIPYIIIEKLLCLRKIPNCSLGHYLMECKVRHQLW